MSNEIISISSSDGDDSTIKEVQDDGFVLNLNKKKVLQFMAGAAAIGLGTSWICTPCM
jgi:hypothetical protein